MRTNLLTGLRTLAVVFVLGFASVPAADAGGWAGHTVIAQPAPRRETLWGVPRDDPAIAVGAIVGGIALLVLFAWVAVRIGDER